MGGDGALGPMPALGEHEELPWSCGVFRRGQEG